MISVLISLQEQGYKCESCDKSCLECKGPGPHNCTTCPAQFILTAEGRCLPCCTNEKQEDAAEVQQECCNCTETRGILTKWQFFFKILPVLTTETTITLTISDIIDNRLSGKTCPYLLIHNTASWSFKNFANSLCGWEHLSKCQRHSYIPYLRSVLYIWRYLYCHICILKTKSSSY